MPFKADKSNVLGEMLRWSLFKGSREFGCGETTLGQKLAECGEVAGPDECFSTSQLLRSLYGAVYVERLRKVKEEADKLALGNAIVRGEYVNRVELEQLHAAIATHIKTVVRGSRLTREEQDDVLRSMSDVKVRVADIASRQRRGQDGEQGSGNGSAPSEPGMKRKGGRPRKTAEVKQPAPSGG